MEIEGVASVYFIIFMAAPGCFAVFAGIAEILYAFRKLRAVFQETAGHL